jgi:hypothetical protein
MLSLLSMRKISLALLLSILTGCAQHNTGMGGGFTERFNPAPYAQSDFDELIEFGGNMANMNAASRSELCRSLLKRQKESPGPGLQLHLMVGRLLSDACGDIPRILDGVASIPAGYLNDERMTRLVAIDTEALKRMNSLSKKLGSVESKQKTLQTVQEPKETSGSKKDENRLLREKLDAIRSMEKQLDESGEGN